MLFTAIKGQWQLLEEDLCWINVSLIERHMRIRGRADADAVVSFCSNRPIATDAPTGLTLLGESDNTMARSPKAP